MLSTWRGPIAARFARSIRFNDEATSRADKRASNRCTAPDTTGEILRSEILSTSRRTAGLPNGLADSHESLINSSSSNVRPTHAYTFVFLETFSGAVGAIRTGWRGRRIALLLD